MPDKLFTAELNTYSFKFNENWEIVNIPREIDKKYVETFIHSFLSRIVAAEFPTSMMCNCNCQYCYITEKWCKNKKVHLEDIKKNVVATFDKILDYNNPKKEYYFSAWGAEPFCELETLEYLLDFCIEHGGKFNTSTNGTILNVRAKRIYRKMFESKCGESIQISLDGPQPIQDSNRPMYNKASNYDNLLRTVKYLSELRRELGAQKKLYSFCSTLMCDENLVQKYKDTVNFFFLTEDDDLRTSFLPSRIENHKFYTKEDIRMVEECLKYFLEFAKSHEDLIISEFYTNKIFGSSCRKDGYVECSAINTQLGIDLDGSIYCCHGPITTTSLKEKMRIGNILKGFIDFKRLIFNHDIFYRKFLHYGKCKNCPVMNQSEGFLCFSCPPSAASLDGNFSSYDPFKCKLYQTIFPYTKEINNIWMERMEKKKLNEKKIEE